VTDEHPQAKAPIIGSNLELQYPVVIAGRNLYYPEVMAERGLKYRGIERPASTAEVPAAELINPSRKLKKL
jgi:hypothetical protein